MTRRPRFGRAALALAWTLAIAGAATGPTRAAPPDTSPTLAPATNLPESHTAAPSPRPSGAASPTALAVPPTLSIRGQVLSLGSGYLVFTTGEALHLGKDLRIPPHTPLGIFVRATLDTATRSISALAFQPKDSLAGELDAAHVPHEYLASSVESLPSLAPVTLAGPLARSVTLTIRVNVPDTTPLSDDVYLATDRSNFGSAEVRMSRVDLHRWTAQLSLASGTSLRYEFTRGFNATVERDRTGGIVTPRSVTVTDGLTTDDTVARWSDIQ